MGRTGCIVIPARVHFCWIGNRLPWAYVFAILSAAERSELPEIILHHTDILEDGAELRALRNSGRVQMSRIDARVCLEQAEQALGLGGELVAIYLRLQSPVMRTDILRAAILYLNGGIYLDLDTVTTASLRPLLNASQFVGSELIVWPYAVRASRSPARWLRHIALDLLRKVFRWMPNGWKSFRLVENFYFRGVNNAVMGAEANAPLFSDYLRAMCAMPLERQTQPYALGPDLLQEVVDRYRGQDLTVHGPDIFYPLPPEISEHWFRIGRDVRLSEVLSTQTRVVHWYASVRTKSRVARITPDYVREHQSRQLYSALICSCIRHLPDAI
jgi:hypothetical protein